MFEMNHVNVTSLRFFLGENSLPS